MKPRLSCTFAKSIETFLVSHVFREGGVAKSASRLNHFTRERERVVDPTYLVVLDREQNETVGVLLQEGLVGLKLLSSRSSLGNLDGLLGDLVGGGINGVERPGVLLANGLEVKLLDGRVAHLEILEGGSSLRKDAS